ncbi:MAG: lectin-like protein [Candidatus Poribacteria bacterium]|nr:lectin-like protein [Candidatus Poribacteria bacterium]
MTNFDLTKQMLFCITFIILFSFGAVYQSIAEEQTSTLSGRISDVEGKPISNVSVVLLYVENDKNGVYPVYSSKFYPFLIQLPMRHNAKTPNEQELQKLPPYLESKTDEEGRFTFTDITTKTAQLLVLPKIPPGKKLPSQDPEKGTFMALPEIQSIQFGEVSFYPHQFSYFPPLGAVTFAIKPRTNIENVHLKVIMENPLNIRGRIVFENEEPLSDTALEINIGHLNLDGTSRYPFSLPVLIQTDADGYFNRTVVGPGVYVLSVNYRGLSTLTKPFFLKGKQPSEIKVLTLNGNPDELDDLPVENGETEEAHPLYLPNFPSMWIINPENGHAYKWVKCNTRSDAQIQAEREDAYLVTITSEAEQIWLEAVFGTGPYWIGLTDVQKEGKWRWDNGEPLKYTNWIKIDDNFSSDVPALLRIFGVKDKLQVEQEEKQDYAIMSSPNLHAKNGKWIAVESENSHFGRTRMAILEKDSVQAEREVAGK